MKLNEWPIVIAGPPRGDFLFKNGKREEFILTLGGKLYPTAELRKWTPKFVNLPVYDSHLAPDESPDFDPREYRSQRVGHIDKAAYFAKERQVRAVMRVTDDTWQARLLKALHSGKLNKIGISMTPRIFESTELLKVTKSASFPRVEIMGLHSVDLCEQPLFGGRFLGEPANGLWQRYTREWLKKQYGAEYYG